MVQYPRLVLLLVLLMAQGSLPLNPQGFPGLSWDLAFNTAVSFVTNTNWQAYSGENTLSYLSQMAGLTVQNFLSAATGIAVAFALIRAFARRSSATIGNAWIDILRITLYVLLPLSLLIALFFVSQGTLQNFLPYLHVTTLEGGTADLADGASGLAGSNQDARHQRWRLLRCQLGASVLKTRPY
ncbi:potassium-transporting ATPase subunit A [Serratia fonticola]|uniref:Potassium-transporting ATPase subunit A n=1 Tax=Serratia fonticola TaxID=47917 RepID=A0A4U9TWH0_SERFO|nr:potassium-transporting ATPase subunit A [Serratia fonticola]